MDVSDGLLSDLAKICSASGNVARVEAPLVPVHPKAGKIFPDTAFSMALNGGEDYELLFTASPTVMATLQGKLEHGFHVIGTIAQGTPGQVDVFDKDGVAIDVQAAGWDHLKS
jgi:thiamine-monophosphate kinase